MSLEASFKWVDGCETARQNPPAPAPLSELRAVAQSLGDALVIGELAERAGFGGDELFERVREALAVPELAALLGALEPEIGAGWKSVLEGAGKAFGVIEKRAASTWAALGRERKLVGTIGAIGAGYAGVMAWAGGDAAAKLAAVEASKAVKVEALEYLTPAQIAELWQSGALDVAPGEGLGLVGKVLIGGAVVVAALVAWRLLRGVG